MPASDSPSAPLGLQPQQLVWLGVGALIAVIAGLALGSAVAGVGGSPPGAALGSALDDLVAEPAARTLEPYEGHGAWVDAFDYVPAYAGGEPALEPGAALDEMAAAGVRTVYLQAARADDRALGLIVDGPVVARWLVEAHRRDLAVVAWYLPNHTDTDADLAHVEALHDFDVLGHRFDGVALDIESREVDDVVARTLTLIDLSNRLEEVVGDDPVGAIVLPPVLLEVVNPDFWPGFPWRDLAPAYDVWLPMTYWSERRSDSGYRDGYTYVEESTRRLLANLGADAVPVHPIGGIGDDVTDEQLARYGDALAEVGAVGGSIYDWRTLPADQRPLVAEAIDRP